MIDEEKLEAIERGWKHGKVSVSGLNTGNVCHIPLDELIRLARLGLWAEKHGVPALEWYSKYFPDAKGAGAEFALGYVPKDALASLPKDSKT